MTLHGQEYEIGVRALASGLALGADTTLVTWDEELKRAAAQSGCAVAPAG